MIKKRILKYPHQRRPKEVVNFREFAKEISRTTGYREDDIRKVWRVGIELIISYMIQRKSVILPLIGMFYPAIKTARTVMSLNGGVGTPDRMRMPDRWTLKFRPGNHVKAKLLEIDPTKAEIDDLYRD